MTDWNTVLAPSNPWREAYPVVAAAVRGYLEAHVIAPATIGTSELAKSIVAGSYLRDPVLKARLFRALKALAAHDLSDCVRRGEPVKRPFYNRQTVRPLLWSAPNLVEG